MDQQSDPIVQQEQPNFQPQKPLRKIWQVVALVVAGILVVAGASYGSYYVWQNYGGGQRECAIDVKLCPDGSYVGRAGENCEFAPCPSNETAGWQTYRNEEYGYEFKYPTNWEADTYIYQKRNALFGPNATNQGSALGGVEIVDYSDSLNAYLSYKEANSQVELSNKRSVIVAGINGIRADYQTGQTVLIKNGNNIITIYISSKSSADLAFFDQILFTFKFIDSTAGWQTYRNEEYGFEIRHPEDYTIKKSVAQNNQFVTFSVDNFFQIVIYPTILSLDDFIKNQEQGRLIGDYQKVSFLEQGAYEGVNQGMISSYEIVTKNEGYIYELIFNTNGQDTLLELKAGLTTEQSQILSTFKFIP